MHKNKKKYARTQWYRHPKTTQERRANGTRKDTCHQDSNYQYTRKKRTGNNLVNSWDDIHVTHEKSWKSRRKTQYKGLTNSQHYGIIVENRKSYGGWGYFFSDWHLKDYFEENEIAYKINELKDVRTYWNDYHNKWSTWSSTYAYYVEWWYDKDICIEKVLKHYPI